MEGKKIRECGSQQQDEEILLIHGLRKQPNKAEMIHYLQNKGNDAYYMPNKPENLYNYIMKTNSNIYIYIYVNGNIYQEIPNFILSF